MDESHITEENDKKIISNFKEMTKDITDDLDGYRFHLASEKLYHYIWHKLADEILEESKSIINSGSAEVKLSRQNTLLYVLRNSMILLHPFMPFITEEIWGEIDKENLLIISEWPIK